MQIKSATATRLLAIQALKTIAGDRVYRAGRMPKNQNLQPPFVVIRMPSKTPIYDHDGYSGLTDALLEIYCFSHNPDQADQMAAIIRQSMEAWPGETDDVDACMVSNEPEDVEQNTLIHFTLLEVNISYHE